MAEKQPDPDTYFSLDLDRQGLSRLDRKEALDLLDKIRLAVVDRITDERSLIVAAEVEEEQARHKPGAQARAASNLGLSTSRVSVLYKAAQTRKGRS